MTYIILSHLSGSLSIFVLQFMNCWHHMTVNSYGVKFKVEVWRKW